ncbi:hypothetical protein E2C01_085994 [Portunus trituberculatus]|uniref:Reverse transcriptase domain-containing protein n=1 Tax=Portunus trituberculatus TaxID=210409 RepID=A0A5B7JAC7_PORTR|nr:hypothetical protein [Portunus trituberculatus]
MSLYNLLNDREYVFRQGRSIGDILAFLTESWSSSFRNFGETFADDTTQHLSTSFQRRPTLQDVNRSRRDTTERLTCDLSKISEWGRENLVVFNASKTQFLHLSTRHNLPDNYPLFFNGTQLSPSSTLNILGLSFTHNLDWKLYISPLAKTASTKLGVLRRLRQFFSLLQLLTLYKSAVVQWNHACFGILEVSKRTGSNPVHGLSVGWASSLGATVS